MDIETFEVYLDGWNKTDKNVMPWEYMGIDKEMYFELLLELSHKKQKEQQEAMFKEDGQEQTGTFNVDEMSVVYFVLLLSVGVVGMWLVLMLFKTMFGGE